MDGFHTRDSSTWLVSQVWLRSGYLDILFCRTPALPTPVVLNAERIQMSILNVYCYIILVEGKDLICVQSIDGSLSVFDHQNFCFTRNLIDSLLPGPLAYVMTTDSIVTTTSSLKVECYK